MSTATVSIVMPFYNETAFLRTGIDSILSQGVEQVEILVVNDNPDRYDQAFFDAMGLPEVVRVLHHEKNAGLSAARNTGIAAARGKWIAFLDSDDYFLPGGLKKQIDAGEEHDADMVHGMAVRTAFSRVNPDLSYMDAEYNAEPLVVEGNDVVPKGFNIFSSWSSLYKLNFLNENNIIYDPEQRIYEDRLFVVHSLSAARKLVFLGIPVRNWRRRQSSITTTSQGVKGGNLKAKAVEKSLDHWKKHPVDGDKFVTHEFVKQWLTILFGGEFSPFGRALGRYDDAESKALDDRIQSLVNKYKHTDAEIAAYLANDHRMAKRTGGGRVSVDDVIKTIRAAGAGDFTEVNRVREEIFAASVAEREALLKEMLGAPAPIAPDPQLKDIEFIIHIGLHKTGSTYIQDILDCNRAALAAQGVLFPKTGFGFPLDAQPVRPGGIPGHQKMMWFVKEQPEGMKKVRKEILSSGCKKVIISIENLSAPSDMTISGKTRFNHFMSALGADPQNTTVVAMVRRPDHWIDSFYREVSGNGLHPLFEPANEFILETEKMLSLPQICEPFEELTGEKVKLASFDDSVARKSLLEDFLKLTGCEFVDTSKFNTDSNQRYVSPCNAQIKLARLINIAEQSQRLRQAILRSFFAISKPTGQKGSLLHPDIRLTILDKFEAHSATFAAERGYAPDYEAWKAEVRTMPPTPEPDIPGEMLEAMITAQILNNADLELNSIQEVLDSRGVSIYTDEILDGAPRILRFIGKAYRRVALSPTFEKLRARLP